MPASGNSTTGAHSLAASTGADRMRFIESVHDTCCRFASSLSFCSFSLSASRDPNGHIIVVATPGSSLLMVYQKGRHVSARSCSRSKGPLKFDYPPLIGEWCLSQVTRQLGANMWNLAISLYVEGSYSAQLFDQLIVLCCGNQIVVLTVPFA